MTAQDWIDIMPIVADKGWRVRENDRIVDLDGRCPICSAVYEISGGEIDRFVRAREAARDLVGVEGGVRGVMTAADCFESPLRPALMKALGMVP